MKKTTNWKKIAITFIILAILLSIYVLIRNNGWSRISTFVKTYEGLLDLYGAIISTSAVVSICILVKQIKGEHEKSRREKCLDLLMTWTTHLTPETNFAVKIVEQFDREQCTKLCKMEEFSVSSKLCYEIKKVYSDHGKEDENAICKYLNNEGKNDGKNCAECKLCKKDKKSGNVPLDKYYIKKLRFSIIQYLNLLETVLIGWQNGIVDRDIIESQFTYLHDPTNNKNCLQDFRTASGSEETYPSIEAFCIKLVENRKKKLKGKDYIA